MSISEDIALDVADLPALPFDVEGPVIGERVLGEQQCCEQAWEQGREGAPSRTADHGIDDASPPTSAPASHPLLEGS